MYEDSHTRMAKASYAPMFETVSGALNKINKKSPHAADQKMVLTTHRKAASTNPDCSRVYLRGLSSITRTTPVSAEELDNRARFKAVSIAVAERANSLTTLSTDQAAFAEQLNSPTGKKTFKAYLWKVCGDAYDAQH